MIKFTKRLRFSLKFVLLIFLFLSVFATIFAARVNWFRNQEVTAEKLRAYAELSFTPSPHWYDAPVRMFLKRSQVGFYRQVYFSGSERMKPDMESECVDLMVSLVGLEYAQLGELCFSMASCDRCVEAGLSVDHYGLYDFRPEKNFIRISNYAEVDLKKSYLSIEIDADLDSWTGYVEVQAQGGPYVSQFDSNSHLSAGFAIPSRVDQEKHTKPKAKTLSELMDNGHIFYDGIHSSPCDFKARLISINGHVLHLDFDFATALIDSDFLNLSNCARVAINAELEVRDLTIQILAEEAVSVDQANSVAKKFGFDPSQFSLKIDQRNPKRIAFTRKRN